MEQNQTLELIHSNDIQSRVKDLPVIQMGIRDVVPKIQGDIQDDWKVIKPIEEEYDDDHAYSVEHGAKHLIDGKDYHADLERLHKSIKPFIPDGLESNAHDNYIHDVLKRGKPSGETVAHLHDIMYGETPQKHYNEKYLTDKWEPFLNAHAKEKQSIMSRTEDSKYTQDELNSIPSNFNPVGLRIVRHIPSMHLYEFHPKDGLKFVAPAATSKYSEKGEYDSSDEKLHASLTPYYSRLSSGHVHQYTVDSAAVNIMLHKKHIGEERPNYLNKTKEELENHSDGISAHFETIAHPTHIPDFHVYTGLYQESNPANASKVDEHGNLIFHNPSFTSTSLSPETAEFFAKMKNDARFNRQIADVMKIKIPGGYHRGAYVAPISNHEDEKEFLLDKGHTFKLHPQPTHHVVNGMIIRQWDATISPRDVEHTIPFEQRTRHQKLDSVLHPDATRADLIAGVKDESTVVQSLAARHPKLDTDSMRTLIHSDSPKVRQAVMLNPSLPASHMIDGIKDPMTAKSITLRDHIPDEVIPHLIEHEFESVQSELAKRHDLKPEHIGQLIQSGGSRVMESLAGNGSLHPDLLHEFVDHPNTYVRIALADNPNIHHKTWNKLVNDAHHMVRTTAGKNPIKYRGVEK